MPRLKRYCCTHGESPHDEAYGCGECGELVCGYHAEWSGVDGCWLCPLCKRAEEDGCLVAAALGKRAANV